MEKEAAGPAAVTGGLLQRVTAYLRPGRFWTAMKPTASVQA
jgi:hypothetical protein